MLPLLDLPRGTISTTLCAVAWLRLRRSAAWPALTTVLLALLPLLAGRCVASWRSWLRALGKHPGTREQRALCFNPALAVADFEERFLGQAQGLKSYDFIVVGSGSAGCACAARLARTGSSVLLVEAGGEAHRSSMTQQSAKAFGCWQSEIDWGLRTTAQEYLLPEGRVVDLERGKTLGGSSAINYNFWVHGAPQDFDRWAEQYGCDGWSYKDVLPHFKAIERVVDTASMKYNDDFRGRHGPIAVSPSFPPEPEVEHFFRACESLGGSRVADYNAGQLAGASHVQLSTGGIGGGRQDTFSTFVEPLLPQRPSFQVVSETFCRKVLLEGSRPLWATGVELELRTGERVQVLCKKEVVLCAGALMTPQLLLLSGLGDREHLEELGIECKHHLPAVGQNLSDHLILHTVALQPPGYTAHRGRTQSACGTPGAYFWQSSVGQAREQRLGHPLGPDVQTLFLSRHCPSLCPKLSVNDLEGFLARWTPDCRSSLLFRRFADLAALFGRLRADCAATSEALCNNWQVCPILNQPQSRGWVKLQSAHPHVPPLVNPNYLAETEDVDTLVAGVRQAFRIFSSEPFEKIGLTSAHSLLSADSDKEALERFVRQNAKTCWHYSCTTRMGPADDPTCVCDVRGRVQGVSNLRVADAGLMPEVISANINAACVMIGDRIGSFMAADMAAAS